MNFALWVTQILLVVVFGYSALIKGTRHRPHACPSRGCAGRIGVVGQS